MMDLVGRWQASLNELTELSESTIFALTDDEKRKYYEITNSMIRILKRSIGIGFGEDSVEKEVYQLHQLMPSARIILDVGANAGKWSRAAMAMWPDARIYMYEPQSTWREHLHSLAGEHADRLTFLPTAASDAAGQVSIYRPSAGSALASLHKRDLARHELTFDDSEQVKTTTLSAEMERLGLSHIDILKIDVEGHELGVLKGLGERLPHVRLIQFEFGGTMIDSRTFLRDIYNLLEPAGFTIFWRITPSGVARLGPYSEASESFDISNYIAKRG